MSECNKVHFSPQFLIFNISLFIFFSCPSHLNEADISDEGKMTKLRKKLREITESLKVWFWCLSWGKAQKLRNMGDGPG